MFLRNINITNKIRTKLKMSLAIEITFIMVLEQTCGGQGRPAAHRDTSTPFRFIRTLKN